MRQSEKKHCKYYIPQPLIIGVNTCHDISIELLSYNDSRLFFNFPPPFAFSWLYGFTVSPIWQIL